MMAGGTVSKKMVYQLCNFTNTCIILDIVHRVPSSLAGLVERQTDSLYHQTHLLSILVLLTHSQFMLPNRLIYGKNRSILPRQGFQQHSTG